MFRVEFIGIPGVGKSTIARKLVHSLKSADEDRYLTLEQAFLYVCKAKVDKPYRIILKGIPDIIAIRLSNKLINRSLMQFDAQNRFLAKSGKSFDAFLSSMEFDNLSIDDRQNVISAFIIVFNRVMMPNPISF